MFRKMRLMYMHLDERVDGDDDNDVFGHDDDNDDNCDLMMMKMMLKPIYALC